LTRELRRPRALRPGGLLAVISPASTPRPELVHAGMRALEAQGYRTRLFPHALDRGPLYYAGHVESRLADLHAAFADPEVDAVICTRGGWGSAELLPHLDAELIRAARKPFLGYSDHTSLHAWMLNEAGLVTFQAPMVAADWSRPDGFDLRSWRDALEGKAGWDVGPAEGLRVLRAGLSTQRVEGVLTGGCVSIYAESLGTPFAPRPRGGVLFLEDIGHKPYQWDRSLVHLWQAGMFAGVTGVVFGDMAQSAPPDEQAALEASLLHAMRDFAGPLAIGLRSAHVSAGNVTLPFGVCVELDLHDEGNPRMHFREAAVEG
jgi:muramoyltetrapeptide carboxypeptidase